MDHLWNFPFQAVPSVDEVSGEAPLQEVPPQVPQQLRLRGGAQHLLESHGGVQGGQLEGHQVITWKRTMGKS